MFQVPGVYSLSGRIIHGWLNSGSPSGEGATTWGFGSDTGVPSPAAGQTSASETLASETSATQPSQSAGACTSAWAACVQLKVCPCWWLLDVLDFAESAR